MLKKYSKNINSLVEFNLIENVLNLDKFRVEDRDNINEMKSIWSWDLYHKIKGINNIIRTKITRYDKN